MKDNLKIILALMLFCGACEFPGGKYALHINNESDNPIYVYAAYILPDTLLPEEQPPLKEIPKKTKELLHDNEVDDEKFEMLNSKRLTVFILNKDTVDHYDWPVIADRYLILKRYEFNREELRDEMNGQVTYP